MGMRKLKSGLIVPHHTGIMPKGVPVSKPMSRDVLGPPPLMHANYCARCKVNFMSPIVSDICPSCWKWAEEQTAKAEGKSDGNLPEGVMRVKKAVKPIEKMMARPKVQGERLTKGGK